MDMPIRFDFIEYTKVLIEAGVPRDQAEAHALALTKAISEGTASSGELVLTRQELLMRMEVLKQEVVSRIDVLKEEIFSRIDVLKGQIFSRIDVLKEDVFSHIDVLKHDLLTRLDLRIDQLKQELAEQIDNKITALRAGLVPKFNLAIWLGGLSLAVSLINSAMMVYLIASHHI